MYEPDPNSSDKERLAVIQHFVGDMHQRLFGNGQPGEIQTLKERVESLEKWMWRVMGAAGALASLAEIYHILKG